MSLLNRDQILTAEDLVYEEVPVPEWGGAVRVRTLTGTERDAFEEAVSGDGKKKNLTNFRARLLSLTVVNEEGKPLFTHDDIRRLGLKNANAVSTVFDVAARLAGISKDDVEELAKDFDDAQSGPSTSG